MRRGWLLWENGSYLSWYQFYWCVSSRHKWHRQQHKGHMCVQACLLVAQLQHVWLFAVVILGFDGVPLSLHPPYCHLLWREIFLSVWIVSTSRFGSFSSLLIENTSKPSGQQWMRLPRMPRVDLIWMSFDRPKRAVPVGTALQLVEKWPVWLHNQTGRKVNEG